MPLAIPVVWREPSNHSSDCYFCLTPPVASGMSRKKKQRIDYPNIPSASDLCLMGKICVSGTSLCQKDMAYQKDFGARTQKCKASFNG